MMQFHNKYVTNYLRIMLYNILYIHKYSYIMFDKNTRRANQIKEPTAIK